MITETQKELSRALSFVLELRDCGATTNEAMEQAAVAYDVDEQVLRHRFDEHLAIYGA